MSILKKEDIETLRHNIDYLERYDRAIEINGFSNKELHAYIHTILIMLEKIASTNSISDE